MSQADKQSDKTTLEKTIPKPSLMKKQPKHEGHVGWWYGSLIFFCFIAGFLGAWLFLAIAMPNLNSDAGFNSTSNLPENAISKAAKKVSPSVVSIVTQDVKTNGFLASQVQEAAGTGMIISSDGYILTNRHVVSEGVDEVSVIFTDGTVKNDVEVVGRDPLNDLAFLKIKDVDNLKPVEFGDSSRLNVGTRVVAIGNALGRYQTTVTEGIISGLSRPLATNNRDTQAAQLSNLLQTDAAINPGNSGGPLITLDGKVIGINTAIATNAEGIGFAIPINQASNLAETVVETGKVSRPYLGVVFVSVDPSIKSKYNLKTDHGALIVQDSVRRPSVLPGSPADGADLKPGDVLVKVNGKDLTKSYPLTVAITDHDVGEQVSITYLRDGQEQTTTVTLKQYQP